MKEVLQLIIGFGILAWIIAILMIPILNPWLLQYAIWVVVFFWLVIAPIFKKLKK